MTIEIRQLVIRAEVVGGDGPRPGETNSLRGRESLDGPEDPPDAVPPRQGQRQEEIVEACVRQVLRRLERHRDR